MSLIRQIWLLLLGTLLLALLASVSINVSSARDTLQTQLRLKNSDNATALAQVLSQQKGQRELMELVAAAQFDTGFYQRIRFTGADGRLVFEREAPAKPLNAPAWFVALAPIESAPGVAQVSDGWHALGSIEVISQAAYAHDELWQGSLRAAYALAIVGVLAGLLAALGVGRIRRPLDQTVEQAASLQRGEYLTVLEPRVPELRRLTRAMNSMVSRLRVVFEAQAEQVESLRRHASCDPLTGVSNRAHFMARLDASLKREDAHAAGGLVLLRVLDLVGVNRRLGRESTDRMIRTIADTLQSRAEQIAGSFVGRLNGADFALALPEDGIAADTARNVVDALSAALPAFGAQVAVAAGAVETRHGEELGAVMGAADFALATAESGGAFTVFAVKPSQADFAGGGEQVWREYVREALNHDRARLAAFPVVNAVGTLLHLESPLRLQLEVDGAFETAARWLPLAIRSRLTGDVDMRALALALEAVAHDGQPRGVNVSPASLLDSGFAARVRTLLLAAPRAARALWIEVDERAAVDDFDGVREFARQVRPTGARVGLEHAGERLSRLERLFEAGLDFVKLDASIAHGVAADAQRAGFVEGLTTMLHSLSLQVIAEGVASEADALALWACGLDGLTGPWIKPAANGTAR
jgi:diguanylate cyclase (GGDEF)-like protein